MTATPRVTFAEEMKAAIKADLTAQGLPLVHVTLDPREIVSGSRHGVVVITPPNLSFPSYTEVSALWELSVIAGPADNLEAAWNTLDAIIHVFFMTDYDLNTAEGFTFQPKTGAPLPGYTVTLHPHLTIEKEIPAS